MTYAWLCGTEVSEYQRLFECETHKKPRFELPGDIGNHQQQANTSKERLVWEGGLTVTPYEKQATREKTQNTSKNGQVKARGPKEAYIQISGLVQRQSTDP